jgi:Uma2 family endonuclease
MNPVAAAQKMTAGEFFEWVQRPENEGQRWELVRGEVVEMSRPGERHGLVCGNIVFVLGLYVRQRHKGYALSNDPGVLLERDPDTVRGPDVVSFDRNKEYAELNPKWIEDTPALAVEVLSPNDKLGKVVKRVGEFLRSGIRLVWVVDPEAKDVAVYSLSRPVYSVEERQELTGDDVLPDFRCRVADFFFTTTEDKAASA